MLTEIMTWEVWNPETQEWVKFSTREDAFAYLRSRGGPLEDPALARDDGCRLRRCRPRSRQKILRSMLEAKGLGHLQVWYRHRHPSGWMVNEEYDPDGTHGMQRLGYNFSQAVAMLRGDTIDFMYGSKKRDNILGKEKIGDHPDIGPL